MLLPSPSTRQRETACQYFMTLRMLPGHRRRRRPCLSGLLFSLELHLIVIGLGSKRRRLPALLLKYDNSWSLVPLTPHQGRAGKFSLSLEQKHRWPARRWQDLRTPNWCVSAAVTPAAPAPRPSEPHEPKPRLPEGPRAMAATSRCGVATQGPEHTSVRCSSH